MKETPTGDSVVDEVYAIRAQIAEECGYDIRRILDHAEAAASKISGLKYVSLQEMKQRRRDRLNAKSTGE